MSYSKSYFAKELYELVYDDIVNFFVEEKDESDKIEFKSYVETEGNETEKINVIIKNICALLNSEGGIVIWGAPKGLPKPGEPKQKIYKGDLSPVPKEFDKDTLIRRITDGITPAPRGIIIQSLKNENRYLYIIEVEKSIYSPHQFQHKYYMRVDGLTVTAPHHYIEALFKKITYPKLEGYMSIINATCSTYNPLGVPAVRNLFVRFFVFNTSKLQNAENLSVRIVIDNGLFTDFGTYKHGEFSQQELVFEKAKPTLFCNEPLCIDQTISIPPDEDGSNEINVVFFFGCKTSPLMVSKYVITLDRLMLGGKSENYNKNFKLIEENKPLHEEKGSLALNEGEKLEALLGRNPYK